MFLEIERKFLVDSSRLPKLTKGKKQIQGYLSQNPEVRVRVEEIKAFLTIKTGASIVREEFEYKIPISDAKKLLKLTSLIVEKTRHRLHLNDLTWEIDFYSGKNQGLVVAEIEIPNPDFSFDKPLWLKEEISGRVDFKNSFLAKNPFSGSHS